MIKLVKKKKPLRGGAVLLEKYGPEYFSKLAKKKVEQDKKALEFYKKHKCKNK